MIEGDDLSTEPASAAVPDSPTSRPRILIYRGELLAYSETFIAAQTAAMRMYAPVFVGLRRMQRSLPLEAPSFVVADRDTVLHRARRYAFLKTGRAPGMLSALRGQRPALVHAHFAVDAAEVLPLVRALRIPLLVTLHGYDVMANDEVHQDNARGRIYLARRKRLFEEASLFLGVSEAIRQKAIERGFPPDKLRVHPIGIDVAQYQAASRLETAPVILFVGRLVEKKGCVHLIHAMSEVRRVLPEARLVVLGDGPERASLEAEARRWGSQAIFLGVQSSEQVRRWMASSRVLAVPSITARSGDAEGLPTVLYEAMAMGLPVACFRSSGIPELVRDEIEGLLVAEADEAGLAQNLLRLCQDDELAQRMGAAGRRRVEQHFELGAQTAELEAIYTGLIEQARLPDQSREGKAAFVPGLRSVTVRKQESRSAERIHASTAKQGARILATKWFCRAKEKCGHLRPSLLRSNSTVGRPTERAGPITIKSPEGDRTSRTATPVSYEAAVQTIPRLRHQAGWMISGNGIAVLFQAIYFVLMGRMLGSREYGAFVGVVALVNVLSQFSSLGMEMILLRNISRDRASFAPTWGKALIVSGAGFVGLLILSMLYGRTFLEPSLRMLVPYVAVSDALFGKLAQLASRALQGADHVAWSARLTALTNGARTMVAGLLLLFCLHGHRHVSALTWVRVYWLASLTVAAVSLVLVTRTLGLPRFSRVKFSDLGEGLSFSLSSSAISVYNDIDKTLLVSMGQSYAAGIYAAAYRVVDVLTTPIYSLYAAAAPRFFREGARGVPSAAKFSKRMLRWTIPFGATAALCLAFGAPMLPLAFGRSFGGSVAALRWLCLLPLIRGMQYAWGTTITASSSQWLRTATQAGAAVLNLSLNLVLIPRWSWQGAAAASLITDGALALSNGLLVAWLLRRRRSASLATLSVGQSQHA